MTGIVKHAVSGEWTWLRLATVLGGVGAGALAALVPTTATYAGPAALGLIGLGLRGPGQGATK